MVTDLWCLLTYSSRGAWHTVYTMLLSNYKRVVNWNSYNGQVRISQINNLFSNNSILFLHSFLILFQGNNSACDKTYYIWWIIDYLYAKTMRRNWGGGGGTLLLACPFVHPKGFEISYRNFLWKVSRPVFFLFWRTWNGGVMPHFLMLKLNFVYKIC